jgi:origin recognition complex subunit 4
MDGGRAPKRRKLDTPEKQTKDKKESPVVTYSKKKENHVTAVSDADSDSRPSAAQSAQQLWAEAKARREANRFKKPEQSELDIYDDIDGAHAPAPRAAASVPRKKKAALDPFRNQRGEAWSSPVKQSAAPVGFFKQFLPKKTFEDEIKELERVARAEAQEEKAQDEDEEEEEDRPRAGALRRSGGRRDKVQAGLEDHHAEVNGLDEGDAVPVAKARPQKPAGRKPQAKAAEQPAPEEPEPEPEPAASTPRRGRPKSTEKSSLKPEPVASSTPRRGRPKSTGKSAPEPVVSSTPRKAKPQSPSTIAIQPALLETEQLGTIQRLVLEQLTARRPISLSNLNDEYAKVSQLVEQTITAGESNSMLLIGARGSGKSTLVNQILAEQAKEHHDDFHVVRLNGFIHTDDKIALREIWRQLGREMDLGEEDNLVKNHADTLATLLALLSHPAEQGLEESPEHITKSVIFILDEFELFAGHPRQTLLYNLFDIAQSRKAPIAVLGLTARIDVAESLEKRVKSRFSHRYVHLSLAKSFAAFSEVCKTTLSLNEEEVSPQVDEDTTVAWKSLLEAFWATPGLEVHLRRLYYTTKSVPDFMSSMLVPVATLALDSSPTKEDLISHFTTTLSTSVLGGPDSKLTLLPSLSTLQLALLICAARLTNIYNTDLVSFNLAYEEYKVLASKAKLHASASGALATGAGARVSGKDVAREAWEALMGMGLVMAEARGGAAGSGRVDVGLEEIGMSGVELGGWGRWCREI